MASAFEVLHRFGPAAFLLKAILAAIVANLVLLGLILLRRAYRKRYFARRDARLLEFRERWHALISGEIPYETWRRKESDRQIVESIVLDAFEAAGPEEAARLLQFLRASGLIEKLIFDARQHKGWRRNRSLVALGRTRALEGIPALSEALRDGDLETRLAAVRGLGRTACPQAGQELLAWIAESGLKIPALPLQSALVSCCAERPRILLPYLNNTDQATREILGRVLGEVATPALGNDLLPFAEDGQAELRAAAARALGCAERGLAEEVLSHLASDPVWFVRLRAVVSLGRLSSSAAIVPLLRCLGDSNRLVRLRAAEALVELKREMARVFENVVARRDRYALHAYLTALDNAGLQSTLKAELDRDPHIAQNAKNILLQVLERGDLPVALSAAPEATLARAASQS